MTAEFDKNRWGTPLDFFGRLNDEFRFTLDAAADEGNYKLPRYLTPEDDTLNTFDLSNERIWLNPPYSDRNMDKWMEWARDQAMTHNNLVVCLIPSNTDTKWWHDYVMCASEIRFVKGRIHFLQDGVAQTQTRHLNSVVVFRPGVMGPVVSAIEARTNKK